MEALVQWFSHNLSQYISPEGAVFFISMIPLLELRGGLLAASLLKIPAVTAIPLCIAGNIIPIPFILLFIRKIFKVMKKIERFPGVDPETGRPDNGKSDQVKNMSSGADIVCGNSTSRNRGMDRLSDRFSAGD